MNDMPRITQEMIDLYDEYTHVSLDRPGFLDRLTSLTGSVAAAESVAALIEADKASAPIVPETDRRLKTQSVTFGEKMTGYLAMPADGAGKLPAVMVVHENRGLVAHIKDVARRAALEGFVALGPDFLAPDGGTPEDEEQGREMIGKLDRGKVIANALAAIEFLKSQPRSNGNVGAVGFCWGGGIVNAVAVAGGGALKAAVPYYGAQPKPEDVGKIKAEMMIHYAGEDERINAGIPAYRDALSKNAIAHQIFMYEGAQHAFNNDTSAARYNKEAADLAWSRTMTFLKQKLA